jgi:acetyl esterase
VPDQALDPGLQALADLVAERGQLPLSHISVQEARERVRTGNQLCDAGPEIASVVDVTVPAASGSVSFRVYREARETARTLVYVHGGSWLTGDLAYADEVCRFLARDAGCSVVSADYRLAPEHQYPAPLDDVLAVLEWASQHAGDGLLGIMGDSAGGNLAAAAAIRAREEGPRVYLQVLVYPVVDHDFDRPSYLENTFPIGRDDMIRGFDLYVPDHGLRDDPTVSPVRVSDPAGLPATHVVVAGHDPLHDEGVEYAQLLEKAGVPVTLSDHPTLAHGFLRFTKASPAAVEARDRLVAAVDGLFQEVGTRPGPQTLPKGG